MKLSDELEVVSAGLSAYSTLYIEGDNHECFDDVDNKSHEKTYKKMLKFYNELKSKAMKPSKNEKFILDNLVGE